MKILNSTVISGNVTKMIETPDNFIISGQLYDKSTFSPVPMSFCPIYVSTNNEMYLKQMSNVYSSWIRNNTLNGYILDINDSNICYVVTCGLSGGGPNGLTRIVTNADGSFTTTTATCGAGTSWESYDIICQDSNKVYYTMERDSTNAMSYIGYVNKSDMSQANINLNTAHIKILKVTDMYIYIATNIISSDVMNIGKYNKSNNTITWLLSDSGTGYASNNIVSDMDDNGVFYCKKDGIGFGGADHYICYRKYVLDLSKDTCVASTVTLNHSIYPTEHIQINTGSTMATMNNIINYTDQSTGKKYVTCVVYNHYSRNMAAVQDADLAMYTYEIIDEDNWTLVSWTKFAPTRYTTILPIINNQTILMGGPDCLHIYTWNSTTHSYQKVTAIDTTIFSFGIDSNNNIYVQYYDKSIEMISNVMPINVFCDFEDEEYKYDDEDIQSNINLYVQNYQNVYLATSVELTLYGQCKFTSNNSKTITVTTSNLDKLQIPVTVTGQGILEVSYNLL